MSERDAALEDAAKIADARAEIPADCERLGPMDWETGVRECSRESRGGACLCQEHLEEAEEIARLIRALKGKQ